jgi:hypothetical protein
MADFAAKCQRVTKQSRLITLWRAIFYPLGHTHSRRTEAKIGA